MNIQNRSQKMPQRSKSRENKSKRRRKRHIVFNPGIEINPLTGEIMQPPEDINVYIESTKVLKDDLDENGNLLNSFWKRKKDLYEGLMSRVRGCPICYYITDERLSSYNNIVNKDVAEVYFSQIRELCNVYDDHLN